MWVLGDTPMRPRVYACVPTRPHASARIPTCPHVSAMVLKRPQVSPSIPKGSQREGEGIRGTRTDEQCMAAPPDPLQDSLHHVCCVSVVWVPEVLLRMPGYF